MGDLVNPHLWQPSDNGFVACSFDPMLASITPTMDKGVILWATAKLVKATTVSSVAFQVRTGATSASTSYVGLYDVAGNRLAVTADISSSIGSTGPKTISFASPTATLPAGKTLLVAWLTGNGTTTAPNLAGSPGGFPTFGQSTTSPYRYGSYGTAQTSLPAAITMASSSSAGQQPWFGLA